MADKIWTAAHMGAALAPYNLALLEMNKIIQGEISNKVELHTYPEGKLGDEKEALKKLLSGSINMMVGTAESLSKLCPEILICDFPFIFNDRKHFYNSVENVLRNIFSEKFKKNGIRLLAVFDGGWRDIFNSKHSVQKPKDLEGLTMRTMDNPIHKDTFKLMGTKVLSISTKESYAALNTGLIDGGDRAASNYYDYKYYSIAPYYSKIGIFMGSSYLIATNEWIESIGKKLSEIVMNSALLAEKKEWQLYKNADTSSIEKIKGYNVKISIPERSVFADATKSIWKAHLHLIEEKTILNSIRELN